MPEPKMEYQAVYVVWDPTSAKNVREVLAHQPHKPNVADVPGMSQEKAAEQALQMLARVGFKDDDGIFWAPQSINRMTFKGLQPVQERSAPTAPAA